MTLDSNSASAREAARIILEAGAVHIRTDGETYFFSSGWASPAFVDLKCLISMPAARDRLIDLMLKSIKSLYPHGGYRQIAGCELAGVPFAAIVASRMQLPLVIALKQARGFDRLSQCEGWFESGTPTLLVDDLTTDGRTKANFKQALQRAGADVIGIFVIFNYGIFPDSPSIGSLTTLADIISVAEEFRLLAPDALARIKSFSDDPVRWSRHHGGLS